MSAIFVLTTADAELEAAWARQLPAHSQRFAQPENLRGELARAGARIWIRDVRHEASALAPHPDTVSIIVGTPHSIPYEDAKINRRDEMFLSYEESRVELRRILPWALELAEKRAAVSINREKRRPPESPRDQAGEGWRGRQAGSNFLEGAIENLGDFPQLLETFKRGIRTQLRSSRVLIYLREGRNYIASPGGDSLVVHESDPFVYWLQEHAGIVDAGTLETIESASHEALLRQRLAGWNARLLLPLQAQGILTGWVALGPKSDGKPYSEEDRAVALDLLNIFSGFILQSRALISSRTVQEDWSVMAENGVRYHRVDAAGKLDALLPVEAQEVVGQCRKEGRRVEREFGRLRVTASPLRGSGDIWVMWDEQGGNAERLALKLEAERYQILHDLGIIISHELANALFSVSTYFQHIRKNPTHSAPMQPLLARVDEDMDRLKEMPHILGTLYEMSQRATTEVTLKTVIEQVAAEVGGSADPTNSASIIWGHEENLRAALLWFCREIINRESETNSPARAGKMIKIRLQQRKKEGAEPVSLISISYPGLRLDQIRIGAAGSVDEYPTVPIFLAREIIRFHHGTVGIGQGLSGPELNITVQSRRMEMPASAAPAVPAFGLHAADLISQQNLRSITTAPIVTSETQVYGQPAVG